MDSAITSTIYASVASSKVVKAWLVHSQEFSSLNLSVKIPVLTTSSCLNSRTVCTNALADHGGFPLQAAMNWSRSSLRTPAVCYIISWQPCTSIRVRLHLIACCFKFLRLPVSRTILNCASRVIFSTAAFAASRFTDQCLRCSWVSAGGVFDEVPVILLDSVPLSPCRGACGAMTCICASQEMMITKRGGKSWVRR